MADKCESENYVADKTRTFMSSAAMPALRNVIRAATYAQICCIPHFWAHCRRGFEQARDGEPDSSDAALLLIRALYGPKAIRQRKIKGHAKLAYRRERSVPVAERFFTW